ncbi:MAG: proline dehydrogenase family protein [Vicinamibacterales bacterium]
MSVMRSVLLAASESRWLRERASKAPFVRRSVSRFMPGESFDDMLVAARGLAEGGIGAVFTRLGEGVRELSEADAVAAHYVEGLGRIGAAGLSAEPSIKLTQLGLDIDAEQGYRNARAVAEAARAARQYLWVDMEQSGYVDATLDVVRRLRQDFTDVGVCLQAYLHRTPEDLESLMAAGIGIRLVKGAYMEPETVAIQKKSGVDAAYASLARTMVAPASRAAGARAVFGTHDPVLIETIRSGASAAGVAKSAYEFHMLYGIQRAEQQRLASAGAGIRVLIAYGEYWYPWYMRRLAERPANVWFVVKNLVG